MISVVADLLYFAAYPVTGVLPQFNSSSGCTSMQASGMVAAFATICQCGQHTVCLHVADDTKV